MNEKQPIPWRRFGFEGALIVVSILGALAIDSWWTNHQLAAEEMDLLRQLKSEFETNQSLLSEFRDRHDGVIAAADAILQLTGPDTTAAEIEERTLQQNIFAIMRWWTYDPQTGVLEGIISAGKLGVISSGSLRTALAAWPSVIRDLQDDEIYAKDFTNKVLDYVNQNTATRDITYRAAVGRSKFATDYESVLRDPAFENVVVVRRNLTTGALTEYDKATAYVETVLEQINTQLDMK